MRNEDFYHNIRNQTIWCNKYIKFKGETLLFKNWIKDGLILVKNLELDNGILDIDYLSRVIRDKRHFYRDINILKKAFRSANINISIEPVKDANIPTHCHHTDEEYNWCIKKSKFYYYHLVEEIITSPVSENYRINFTRLRITHVHLLKSYGSKVKHITDKKLAETNFKILNNILPCNRNLRKWGKSDTDLCCFCQEEENISPSTTHYGPNNN